MTHLPPLSVKATAKKCYQCSWHTAYPIFILACSWVHSKTHLTLVGICLWNWIYCHFTLNIYFPYFLIDNISLFKTNSELYEINTRNINNFHLSQPRLTIYRNCVYYMGIEAFNHLPSHIKRLSDDKNRFKITLKNCHLINSIYSLNDFF
jgi:hypothetical protein